MITVEWIYGFVTGAIIMGFIGVCIGFSMGAESFAIYKTKK